jgi:hypothetical protein
MAADVTEVQKAPLLVSSRRSKGRVDSNTAVRQALLLLMEERSLRWSAFLNPETELFVLTPLINRIRAATRKSTWAEKVLFWRGKRLPEVIARKIRRSPQTYLEVAPASLTAFCDFLEAQAKSAHPSAQVSVHGEKVKEFIGSKIWCTGGSKELIELFFEELKKDSQAYISCVVYRYTSSRRGRGDPAMC